MEFQTSGSRRQLFSAAAMTAGAAIMLRPRLSAASGFAQAFCPQSGQVYFVLLAFFALASLPMQEPQSV